MIRAITQDPHEGEPTVELDQDLWQGYVTAKRHAEKAAEYAERVKNRLILALGDAHAGVVDGRKVVTFRPQKRYAEAQLRARYPDLTQHYVTSKLMEMLDVARFGAAHPEILEQFQVRAFKATIEEDA